MTQRIPQSTSKLVVFKAYLSSDHVSEATGKTIVITISKNGGAFGNPNAGATNATEISSGWYKVTLDTTDTGTLGPLAVRGAVATIDDVGVLLEVAAATNGGWTALPAVAAEAAGGLYTRGTGAGQINQDANGRVDINAKAWLGTAIAAPDTAGYPKVTIKNGTGSGEVKIAAGYLSPNWADVGSPSSAVNLSGTTVDTTSRVNGDVSGSVGSVLGSVGSVVGSVGGNLGGDVLGSVDSVFSPVTLSQTFPTNFSALAISAAGIASADIKKVNGTTVTGSGTAGTPWGP